MAKAVYKAPALDKGLEILELLAGLEKPLGMAEIAQALGRSKPEIYRMLIVLEARGYIARGEHDERYRITSRLFELGMRSAPTRNLHDAALPVMHALAERTLQSCHLAIASRDQLIVVARVESPASVGFSVRVGYRAPLFDSTSGRVIFGHQTAERQAEWGEQLRSAAPSEAAFAHFVSESKRAKKRGYVSEPSRLADGIRDVAAPVFDGEALGAVASLTVPFFTHRYLTASLEEVFECVVEAAADLSHRLRNGVG